MKMNKGFTLIELLVVIAIIGILAAIIIANLGDARNLAKDSSGSATLSSARGQAELFYVSNTPSNTYTNMCADPEFAALIADAQDSISTTSTENCDAAAQEYAVEITLSDGAFYCVDSTGFAGELVASKGAATTVCN